MGHTSNEAELLGLKFGLEFLGQQGWKAYGNYVIVKGDS